MTTETMTIHEGLAELKTLTKRIDKEIRNCSYVVSVKANEKKINGVSIEDFKKNTASSYQKINDLINRYSAIKRAIVLSNATTKIVIGNREYTVAEAIEMKNNIIPINNDIISKMTSALNVANVNIGRYSGEEIEKKAEVYIQNLMAYGNKDGKINTEELPKLKASYIADNTYNLVDPLNVSNEIERLSDFTDEFMTKVDSSLSVSNATTTITIEY